MLYLFLLGIGVALAAVQNQHLSHHDDLWKHWKDRHSKFYKDSKEDDLRRGHWENNLAMIQEHNVQHQLGLKTYSMGLNHLSDLTWDEVKQIYLSGLIAPKDEVENGLPVQWVTADEAKGAPAALDWRQYDMVSPVKNQGHCGSCYTFSTTGAIESQYLRKYRTLKLFSEQQLVDCSQVFGNNGCGGGWQTNCYRYINKYGLESEQDYPYVAYQEECAQNRELSKLNVTGMVRSKYGDEVALVALVSRYGPAAIAVDADQGFAYYHSGVYISESCSPQYLTHAVLIVGYGSDNGQDYWTIKNSWGADWGDKGYIKLGRNYGNMCGVADVPSVPLI